MFAEFGQVLGTLKYMKLEEILVMKTRAMEIPKPNRTTLLRFALEGSCDEQRKTGRLTTAQKVEIASIKIRRGRKCFAKLVTFED